MLGRTVLALGLTFSGSMWAQAVISAHSGVIQLTEGTVELDGAPLQSPAKLGEFQDVKNGQTLATKDGDAEVLLTPGVFLRLAENSSFKMVSNNLSDTRVEVLSGTAMVQIGDLLPDNAITVLFHDADIELSKRGLYRVDSDPVARLRVYEGFAKVTSGDMKPVEAVKGREVDFDDKMEAKNFDTKETDAFYRWNERRDEYIAQANITSARTASNSGYGSGYGYGGSGTGLGTMAGYGGMSGYGGMGMGTGMGMGNWMYNPWFGMFTYVPYAGMYYSPFGYGYYSPGLVGGLFLPGSPYYYGGVPIGYGGVARNGSPTSLGNGLLGAGTRAVSAGGIRGAGPLGGGIGSKGGIGSSGGASSLSGSHGGLAGAAHGGAGGRH
jgi:hypothetical protein